MDSALGFILDKRITATINGKSRQLTHEEIGQQKTLQSAFAGDAAAIREVIGWIEERERIRAKHRSQKTRFPHFKFENIRPAPVDQAVLLLRVARHYPDERRDDDAPYLRLENWAIEAAFQRRKKNQRLPADLKYDITHHATDPDDLSCEGGHDC